MARKYAFINETIIHPDKTLHRIMAVRDFGSVRAGELGGFIEREGNLSHEGDAWVSDNAWVFDKSYVSDNAQVKGDVRIYGSAHIREDAYVSGFVEICDTADVAGSSFIGDTARVDGNAHVGGIVKICNNAHISGNARIYTGADYVFIRGFGSMYEETTFYRNADYNIYVNCGRFHGDIQSFREKVKETYRDTIYAKECLMLVDLMEFHFGLKQ